MRKITNVPVLRARTPRILPDYIPWSLKELQRNGRWRAIDQYHSLDSLLDFLADRGVQI